MYEEEPHEEQQLLGTGRVENVAERLLPGIQFDDLQIRATNLVVETRKVKSSRKNLTTCLRVQYSTVLVKLVRWNWENQYSVSIRAQLHNILILYITVLYNQNLLQLLVAAKQHNPAEPRAREIVPNCFTSTSTQVQ